ncbi:hypothetical protein A1351_16925 [Methylosinus sp. R-45379]|uniref:hypothetical protein n=1 Tax=unclassified Methylosinus TaxID=2624500 RepID=UPI0004667269|nr:MULTISPECIES: hypothetical protein [unclassified Methylosinus]OAI25229.1 hypothetical protein A1351_16925 [Methylosinus sp. R-45379]
MNLPAPPTGLYPEDYERIEAAVMETVRGRWFLLEYARRQRVEETERLVLAVDRLERIAARAEERAEEQEAASDWRLPRRLVERAQEFARTLRASGVEEKLCAQADALVEQFSKLLDAPAAEPEEAPRAIIESATIEIIDEPHRIQEERVEPILEIEVADEPIEIAEVETLVEAEPIDAEPILVESFEMESVVAEPIEIEAVASEPEPVDFEPVAFEPERVAQLEEPPQAIEITESAVAAEPASNEIVFEEFVARAILPEETAPVELDAPRIDAPKFGARESGSPKISLPKTTPAKTEPALPVDPRLVALSRLDHLSLHEKLRLFG